MRYVRLRILGTKPLSEPAVAIYYYLGPYEQIAMTF